MLAGGGIFAAAGIDQLRWRRGQILDHRAQYAESDGEQDQRAEAQPYTFLQAWALPQW